MKYNVYLKNVVSILKKKPEYRLKIDLEILIEGTESNNFFVDTINEYGPETHSECCRYMTYKHLNINEILFQYGL